MRLSIATIVCICCLIVLVTAAAVEGQAGGGGGKKASSNVPMKPQDDGRLIPGLPSIIGRLAFRTLLMKVARTFTQYFVDIFLGEMIGARTTGDAKWAFNWPSWLLTGVDAE